MKWYIAVCHHLTQVRYVGGGDCGGGDGGDDGGGEGGGDDCGGDGSGGGGDCWPSDGISPSAIILRR